MAVDPNAAMAVMWHLELQLGSAHDWEYMWEQKHVPLHRVGQMALEPEVSMAVMGHLEWELWLVLDSSTPGSTNRQLRTWLDMAVDPKAAVAVMWQ